MANKVKKVLGDKIVLTVPGMETNRDLSGLRVPESATNVGVVKFIGEDAQATALRLGIEIGQKVIYASAYEKLEIENETTMVMEIKNVIAVLE